MDVFSHALWGRHLTYRRVNWKLAGLIGVLPDLCAFIPSGIVSFVNGTPRTQVDENTVTSDFPGIAWDLYQISHSLFWAGVLFLLLWFGLSTWLKKQGSEKSLLPTGRWLLVAMKPRDAAFCLMTPWFFHILLDIPSHTAKFFPTPFLMPFSDYVFDGVRWGDLFGAGWWIWWSNIAGIVLVAFVLRRMDKPTGDVHEAVAQTE